MPHLEAKAAQLSPDFTWMVLQSPRAESESRFAPLCLEWAHVAFVAPTVEFVAFVEMTSGVVSKAGPAMDLDPSNERHCALDQDLSASWTGPGCVLVAMKPKMWSTL